MLVNFAVSVVLALLLIFVLRGFANMIFSDAPAPAVSQQAKAPAASPVETKTAEAKKPAEASKPAETAKPAEAAKPAEEAKPAEAAKPAEETKTAEAPAAASGAGDPAAGAKVFKKCKACHYADKEKNKVGPYLKGVVGRKAAAIEGFRYSDALKAKAAEGLTWTEDNLSKWLAKPKVFVPGTKMSFGGLKKDKDIADIIAYLKTMK
jgi:cytochrome c